MAELFVLSVPALMCLQKSFQDPAIPFKVCNTADLCPRHKDSLGHGQSRHRSFCWSSETLMIDPTLLFAQLPDHGKLQAAERVSLLQRIHPMLLFSSPTQLILRPDHHCSHIAAIGHQRLVGCTVGYSVQPPSFYCCHQLNGSGAIDSIWPSLPPYPCEVLPVTR